MDFSGWVVVVDSEWDNALCGQPGSWRSTLFL